METDVNILAQPVAEPTGDTGQPAPGQQQGVTESQPAPEQTVPYDRFKEVNEAKKAAEQENANLRAQFSLLQQTVSAPPPQPQSRDIVAELESTDGEEFVQVKQLKPLVQQFRQTIAATQQAAAREGFVKSKADYGELVGSVNPFGQFVPSEHFQKVLAADPELVQELGNPATAPRIAYRAAKTFRLEQELNQTRQQVSQREVTQQVNLRTNPLPVSAVGGGGAVQRGSELLGLDPTNPADRAKILELTERTTRR